MFLTAARLLPHSLNSTKKVILHKLASCNLRKVWCEPENGEYHNRVIILSKVISKVRYAHRIDMVSLIPRQALRSHSVLPALSMQFSAAARISAERS